MRQLEVLFTPADFAGLAQRDLSQTECVVFDVLRATTSMVAALQNGARAIIPVAEIGEALAARERQPGALLAGERDGVRIRGHLAGGIDFDLGNSPREFTPEKVRDRTIVMTTTNGTRALRACARAHTILAASFLNLSATARFLAQQQPRDLLVVCSGTFEQAAYEDVLGAGAFCEQMWSRFEGGAIADSAYLARRLFQLEQADLLAAVSRSRNGRRLLERAELRDDVAFCAARDTSMLVAGLDQTGAVRGQA